MPNRTIFVRNDDLEDFEAIPDRPSWVHRSIQAEKRRQQAIQLPAPNVVPHSTTTLPDPRVQVVSEAPLERHPTEVNPKSHGPSIEEPTYEPVDEMP